MRAIGKTFQQFLRCVWEDFMVVACLIGPVFMGLAFRIGIPLLEQYLCETLNKKEILASYYPVFDLLLMVMTPLMVAFAGVMAMLEEIDASTARYLCVTPVGKGGYIFSRLGMPVLFSIVYNLVLIQLCSISDLSLVTIIFSIGASSVASIMVSLFVVGFAKNKVEGMALMKLSGLLVAAALIPFFVHSKISYLLGVLPCFWMGQYVIDSELICIPLFIVSSGVWIFFLYRKFAKKLM